MKATANTHTSKLCLSLNPGEISEHNYTQRDTPISSKETKTKGFDTYSSTLWLLNACVGVIGACSHTLNGLGWDRGWEIIEYHYKEYDGSMQIIGRNDCY